MGRHVVESPHQRIVSLQLCAYKAVENICKDMMEKDDMNCSEERRRVHTDPFELYREVLGCVDTLIHEDERNTASAAKEPDGAGSFFLDDVEQ